MVALAVVAVVAVVEFPVAFPTPQARVKESLPPVYGLTVDYQLVLTLIRNWSPAMYLSAFIYRAAAVLLCVVALGIVRYKPWFSRCESCTVPISADATPTQRPTLTVGYLPVT